jgi:hypothetical protein
MKDIPKFLAKWFPVAEMQYDISQIMFIISLAKPHNVDAAPVPWPERSNIVYLTPIFIQCIWLFYDVQNAKKKIWFAGCGLYLEYSESYIKGIVS